MVTEWLRTLGLGHHEIILFYILIAFETPIDQCKYMLKIMARVFILCYSQAFFHYIVSPEKVLCRCNRLIMRDRVLKMKKYSF